MAGGMMWAKCVAAAAVLVLCQRASVFWDAYGRRSRALNTKSSRWMLEQCRDAGFREGMRMNRMEDVCAKVAELHAGPSPLAAGLMACVPEVQHLEIPTAWRMAAAVAAALAIPTAAAWMWHGRPPDDDVLPRALTLGGLEEGWRAAARRARHI